MIKIAITGASGLIGSRVIELLADKHHFIPLTSRVCDITKKNQVEDFFKNNRFDFLLHLAAYTNVDGAETEKDKAWQVNVEGTKNLFEQSQEAKVKFIYISTDFVFDGKKPPFFEDSKPNPISYYGLTKYEGEKIINKQGMIVRIAYPYRSFFDKKKDFLRNLIGLLKKKQKLTMVKDALITPTFIDDIAHGLEYLIKNYSPEIFHLVGSQSLTPLQVGLLIAKFFNFPEDLIQSTTYNDFFKNKAKRPQFSEIRTKKNHFYPMKSFEEGLKIIKTQLKEI